jgi:hypothetical protein
MPAPCPTGIANRSQRASEHEPAIAQYVEPPDLVRKEGEAEPLGRSDLLDAKCTCPIRDAEAHRVQRVEGAT